MSLASSEGPEIPTTSQAQIDALNKMFGGDLSTEVGPVEPIIDIEKGIFTAVGGTLRTTPAGIAWSPQGWSSDVVMQPGATELVACVDYTCLEQGSARTPKTKRLLKKRVGSCLQLRGFHRFPLTKAPERWTLQDLVSIASSLRARFAIPDITSRDTIWCAEPRKVYPRNKNVEASFKMEQWISYYDRAASTLIIRIYLAPAAARIVEAFRERFERCRLMSVDQFAEHVRVAQPVADSAADSDGDDADADDEQDDDDEQDLDSRLILAAVRHSLWPQATWDDIKYSVRHLRYIAAKKKGAQS